MNEYFKKKIRRVLKTFDSRRSKSGKFTYQKEAIKTSDYPWYVLRKIKSKQHINGAHM